MTGPKDVLVGISSATHGRPWETGRLYVCPIDRNHSELVKFTRAHDPDYKQDALPRLIEVIHGVKSSQLKL